MVTIAEVQSAAGVSESIAREALALGERKLSGRRIPFRDDPNLERAKAFVFNDPEFLRKRSAVIGRGRGSGVPLKGTPIQVQPGAREIAESLPTATGFQESLNIPQPSTNRIQDFFKGTGREVQGGVFLKPGELGVGEWEIVVLKQYVFGIKRISTEVRGKIRKKSEDVAEFLTKTPSVKDTELVGTSLFAREFQRGLITGIPTLIETGVGLVFQPIKTTKEVVGGFIDIPSRVREDPFGATGRITGEVISQSLLFRGTGRGRVRTPKAEPVEIIKPADITKTPLRTTFPFEIDLGSFDIKTPVRQKQQLRKFKSEFAPEPIKFDLDPTFVKELEFASKIQRARFKSGADIIKIDKSGIPRIREVPEPKAKGIFAEISPDLIKELKFELDQPKRFDIPKQPKAKKLKSLEEKGIFVELTPEFIREVKFETTLPKRFDIEAPKRKIKKKAKPKPQEPFFTFEFKSPEIKGLDVQPRGRQQLLLRPPKQIQRLKQKPVKPLLKLEGIPRFAGGEGLTSLQLRGFGIQRTAQLQQLQIQSQKQLSGLAQDLKFPSQKQLQAQKFGEFDAIKTKGIQKQRVRDSQLVFPSLKQEINQITKQLQKVEFGQPQITAHRPRQAQPFPLFQPQRAEQRQLFGSPIFNRLEFEPFVPLPPGEPRKKRKDKKKKKSKKVRIPIRPSFTGIILEIEEAPSFISERLGVLPGQIRGLATGFNISRRRKKTKKSRGRFLTDL